MTDAPDERPRATLAEDERAVAAVAEILNDLIVTHDMWIDDEGNDLDYLPEREARIANFINEAADRLAPLLAAARAAERKRVLAEVEQVMADRRSVYPSRAERLSGASPSQVECLKRAVRTTIAARIAEGAEQREDA